MRVCIVGAGAIGGFLAVRLAKNEEVCVIARGDHLSAIQNNGLSLIQDNETLNNFVNNLNDFNSVASSTINNTFDNYDILDDEIGNIKNQNELLILETKNPAAELFFKTDYNLKFEDNLLCNLRGDCKENISVNDAIKNTGVFIEKYPDSSSLKQNCDLLSELDQKYFMVRNETLKIISDKNINFSGNEFLELANNWSDKKVA